MPAITSTTPLILVTGASGFIAIWCVKNLLDRGFHVRGTVRSKDKGEYLVQKFANGKGKFEYVIVEDLEKEHGFDEAVKGVDGILHTASPFHLKADDPYEDLINPAVNGTLSLLRSAKAHGDKVQRVIITSSFASILNGEKPPATVTDANWNETSAKAVEKDGKKAPQADQYRASKVLAERAAWDFIKTESPKFDLATVCPPFVFGPIFHQVPSVDKLNTSVAVFHGLVKGDRDESDLAQTAGNWIDVRDLAQAHVEALLRPEAGNQRLGVGNGPFTFQDMADALHADFASESRLSALPKGQPGAGKKAEHIVFDTSKANKILGLDYVPLDKCSKDMLESIWKYETDVWA